MFRSFQNYRSFALIVLSLIIASCDREDPGPLQKTRESYSIVDFDRLEMGNALQIEVEQANTFSVEARGDRRNIEDLDVYKRGSTLIIEFDDNGERHHDTYVYITMPTLESVNFSGASVSKIRGFDSDEDLDLYLSGASVSQLDGLFREVNAVISGASKLLLFGNGDELNAEVSGASSLKAFDYPVRESTLNVSGASEVKVSVSDELSVKAGGASSILYRGNPNVTSDTSGGSSVGRD